MPPNCPLKASMTTFAGALLHVMRQAPLTSKLLLPSKYFLRGHQYNILNFLLLEFELAIISASVDAPESSAPEFRGSAENRLQGNDGKSPVVFVLEGAHEVQGSVLRDAHFFA